MKMSITEGNPFNLTLHGLVWEHVNKLRPESLLDYGAHDGKFIAGCSMTDIFSVGFGVDLNSSSISDAKDKMPNNVTLEVIRKGEKLPFEDESFECITMLGVLEHIEDQKAILAELHRVLKPKGAILLLVPGQYLFSFLDLGNWKFKFPRIHKYFFCKKHSYDEYKRRYIDCENGLFGDIESEKGWHEHFSKEYLSSLMTLNGFRQDAIDGAGFFNRVLLLIELLLPGPLKRITQFLIKMDFKWFSRSELLYVGRK